MALSNKHRPQCAKMGCGVASDVVLHLPAFGPLYFCAFHARLNMTEMEVIHGNLYC